MINLKSEIQILLQPIGALPEKVLTTLESELPRQFENSKFVTGKTLALPNNAFDSGRNQYVSPRIINWIQKNCKDAIFEKVLGLCDVNAYTGRLNFVFGEAQFGGRIATVYLARLKEEFSRGIFDEGIFLQRVTKECIHELGHLFDLGHCKIPFCVMYFSNTLTDTDRKGKELCGGCKIKIKRYSFYH